MLIPDAKVNKRCDKSCRTYEKNAVSIKTISKSGNFLDAIVGKSKGTDYLIWIIVRSETIVLAK